MRSRPYFSSAWYLRLGILVGDALRAAHLREHFENPILRDAVLLEQTRAKWRCRPPTAIPSNRCSVLTKSSLRRVGFGLSRVGHFAQARRERRLRPAVGRGLLRQLAAQLVGQRLRLDAHLPQQRRDDAVLLLHEGQQEVLGLDLRVVQLLGDAAAPRARLPALFRCTC